MRPCLRGLGRIILEREVCAWGREEEVGGRGDCLRQGWPEPPNHDDGVVQLS